MSNATVPVGTPCGVPNLQFVVGDVCTFSDPISAAPTSRTWTLESCPSNLASPPSLATPTAATTALPAFAVDGTYTALLTRLETDSTTTLQRVVIGVLDGNGHILPSPEFDPSLLAPLGQAAADAGWAGSASTAAGDVFESAILRDLKTNAVRLSGGALTVAGSITTSGGSFIGATYSSPVGNDLTLASGFYTPAAYPGATNYRNYVMNFGDGNIAHASQTAAFVVEASYGIALDFHGYGINALTAVLQVGTGPTVTMSGTPTALKTLVIAITLGGAVGTATATYSINGATPVPFTTAASVLITGTGVTVAFTAGTYVLATTYTQTVDQRLSSMSYGYNGPDVIAGSPAVALEILTVGGHTNTQRAGSNSYFSVNGDVNGLFLFRAHNNSTGVPGLEGKIYGTQVNWAFGSAPDSTQGGAIKYPTTAWTGTPAAGFGWQGFDGNNFVATNSSGDALSMMRTTGLAASAVTHVGSGPTVTIAGTPTGLSRVTMAITTGGALGTSQFTYAVDGGTASAPQATAATFLVPGTGITATFAAGTYVIADTYSWIITGSRRRAPGVNWVVPQASNGAGVGIADYGQQGAAGFAGGSVIVGPGSGGTSGTNPTGSYTIDMGASVSGASQSIRFVFDGGTQLTFGMGSAGNMAIASGSNNINWQTTGVIGLTSTGAGAYFNPVSKSAYHDADVWQQRSNNAGTIRISISATGIGFNGHAPAAQPADVGLLVRSVGTPSLTIPDVGTSFSQATLNNIVASIVDVVIGLRNAGHGNGLTA